MSIAARTDPATTCRKCKKTAPEIPGIKYCPFCGAAMEPPKRTGTRKPNGTGTAYKRGKGWRGEVVVGTYTVTNKDGKKIIRKKKLTKEGFSKKADAMAWCVLTLQDKPDVTRGGEIVPTTLKACYDQWVPFYTPRVSAGQMKSHASAFKWLKDLWAVDMDKLTAAQLQDAIDACPRKRRTKEDIKSLLMCLFKYGIQNDFCRYNRAEYLYCGDDDGQSWPPFSKDEVEKIRTCGLPYADYVYVLIYTGYRPTEFLSLRKEDYDQEHGILFAGIKTEAGKDRHMPVSSKIRGIIDHQFSSMPGELMFPEIETGKEMDDERFRVKAFEPLMEQLGIKGKVPYSCRHTFSNFLKNASGSDKDKAALMGHTDYSLTKRVYQSAEDQALAAIIKQI